MIGRISAPLKAGEHLRIFHGGRLLGDAVVNRSTLSWRAILDPVVPRQGLTDDLGLVQGLAAEAGITNDSTPAIIGRVSAPLDADEVVTIDRDGIAIGTATVASTASCSGDRAGNQGPVSPAHTIELEANRSGGETWRC